MKVLLRGRVDDSDPSGLLGRSRQTDAGHCGEEVEQFHVAGRPAQQQEPTTGHGCESGFGHRRGETGGDRGIDGVAAQLQNTDGRSGGGGVSGGHSSGTRRAIGE